MSKFKYHHFDFAQGDPERSRTGQMKIKVPRQRRVRLWRKRLNVKYLNLDIRFHLEFAFWILNLNNKYLKKVKRMVIQKTIGFVVFKKEGRGIKYLLLHHGGSYWNFPKGRQEAGESELDSAKRELLEETGITDITVLPEYRDEYNYDFDTAIKDGVKETQYRNAIFFIAETKTDAVTVSKEHLDFGWFDYETSLKRMFYQEGQNLLKRAHQYISKQQDTVL